MRQSPSRGPNSVLMSSDGNTVICGYTYRTYMSPGLLCHMPICLYGMTPEHQLPGQVPVQYEAELSRLVCTAPLNKAVSPLSGREANLLSHKLQDIQVSTKCQLREKSKF